MKKIIIFVVVIVLIVGGWYFYSQYEDAEVLDEEEPEVIGEEEEEEVVSERDTLELREDVKRGVMGETIVLGDLKLTLNDASWHEGGEGIYPEEGERWLSLELTLENKSEESFYMDTIFQFSLYDEEEKSCRYNIVAGRTRGLEGYVGEGRSRTGYVGFTVSEDDSNWKLVFDSEAPTMRYMESKFPFGQALFEISENDVK